MKKVGIIFLIVLLCSSSLVKPFHIDDPFFVWMARQIHQTPFDALCFDLNWYGTTMPAYLIMKNPPLHAYQLAFWSWLLGFHEWVFHLAMFPAIIACCLGVKRLTQLLVGHALQVDWLAMGLFVCTPVFTISASTVMCDVPMLALFIWAVILWIKGVRLSKGINKGFYLVSSALLIVLATLTKYFALILVPLLAVYSLAVYFRTNYVNEIASTVQLHPEEFLSKIFRQPLRCILTLSPLLVVVMVLCLYENYTYQLYGKGLLLDASEYATGVRPWGIFLSPR